MKKLTDLNPEWLGVLRPKSGEQLQFDCPKCGPKHRLIAYFSNPLDGQPPAPWHDVEKIWKREGDTFEALTIAPSLQYPCFHGWVEHGLVFDISESPLMVPTKKGPAALSPNQAEQFAKQLLERVAALRDFGGEN